MRFLKNWWLILAFVFTIALVISTRPTEEQQARYDLMRQVISDHDLSIRKDRYGEALHEDYYKIISLTTDEKKVLLNSYLNQYNSLYFRGGTDGMVTNIVGILNYKTKENLKKICWLENIINDISDSGAIPPNGAVFINCDSATYETLNEYVGHKFNN